MKSFKYLRKTILCISVVFLVSSCQKNKEKEDYTQYVNPFIGTSENGHCFPGATLPFGLIQANPITGNCSWAYCSGYQYKDPVLYGFSQTQINGTGCGDLGDILLLPLSETCEMTDFTLRIDKSKETAKPGYYQAYLPDCMVNAELTCSERVAFHKYTYEKGNNAKLLVDLQFGIVTDSASLHKRVLEFDSNIENNNIITGSLRTGYWVDRNIYFVIEFNHPFIRKSVLPPRKPEQRADRYILDFELPDNGVLMTKVALSTVSVDNAKMNMTAEIPNWNFDGIRTLADSKWNEVLKRVRVEGSLEEKENFYTSLYHLFLQPANIADVNGDYRGADSKVSNVPSGKYYSTFSLWDTYRAAHPLYTIIAQESVNDFISSMLRHYKAQGYLPIWTLWGKENHTMVGNHSVPVIVDAYLKGFDGFNSEEAFEAINSSLTENHLKSSWDVYDTYGYYPFDIIQIESVSRTLESVYDDYSAYVMADKMGKKEEANFFRKRSDYYKNLFDPETKIMRPKNSKNEFKKPFSPLANAHDGTLGGDYTEGNAWQYTWHVQHDIPTLIELMGGKDSFITMLDSLFTMELESEGHVLDITGLIGQYAHGNEPSHHVAYLYTMAGKASKTQDMIRKIVRTQYNNHPAGLCGNDDCGQMSAWYIFSCMGFYPVNPCGGNYIFGAPQLPEISLNVSSGKTFNVIAKNISEENKYIQEIFLNGKRYTKNYIHHDDIIHGGELVYMMGNTPLDDYFE